MKKVIKNIIIAISITFTILTIGTFIGNEMIYYNSLNVTVVPILEGEVSEDIWETEAGMYDEAKERFGEDSPALTLSYFQAYFMGESRILYCQRIVTLASLVIGMAIGILVSISDQSKAKEVILFITIGLGLAVLATIITNITYEGIGGFGTDFWDRLYDDFLRPYSLPYILIYLVIHFIRYFINKGKVEKMNDELKANNQNKKES